MKPSLHRNDSEAMIAAIGTALDRATPANGTPRPDRRATPRQAQELCFIRLREVLEICGKSRSSVYESIKRGQFPAPVKLCGRSSAWIKSEVIQWAEACVRASRR